MPFGLWARTGPRNHELRGGPDPLMEGVILREKVARCKNIGTFCRELCRNDLNNRFGVWVCGLVDPGGLKETQVQSYSQGGAIVHNFNRIRQVAPMCPHGRAHWHHLANTIELSICVRDAVLCEITLTLVSNKCV